MSTTIQRRRKRLGVNYKVVRTGASERVVGPLMSEPSAGEARQFNARTYFQNRQPGTVKKRGAMS